MSGVVFDEGGYGQRWGNLIAGKGAEALVVAMVLRVSARLEVRGVRLNIYVPYIDVDRVDLVLRLQVGNQTHYIEASGRSGRGDRFYLGGRASVESHVARARQAKLRSCAFFVSLRSKEISFFSDESLERLLFQGRRSVVPSKMLNGEEQLERFLLALP
jgi:hypothetical protein